MIKIKHLWTISLCVHILCVGGGAWCGVFIEQKKRHSGVVGADVDNMICTTSSKNPA